MAQTMRQAMIRAREDLYVCLVECLECGSPAGTRCTNLAGRPTVTCCGIRADLAQPMAYAILQVILLLRSEGHLTDRPHELPMIYALDLINGSCAASSRTTGGTL